MSPGENLPRWATGLDEGRRSNLEGADVTGKSVFDIGNRGQPRWENCGEGRETSSHLLIGSRTFLPSSIPVVETRRILPGVSVLDVLTLGGCSGLSSAPLSSGEQIME